MRWFLTINDVTTDPLTTEEVVAGIREGRFTRETKACFEGSTVFRPLGDYAEHKAAFDERAVLEKTLGSTCSTRACPVARVAAVVLAAGCAAAWLALAGPQGLDASPGEVSAGPPAFPVPPPPPRFWLRP